MYAMRNIVHVKVVARLIFLIEMRLFYMVTTKAPDVLVAADILTAPDVKALQVGGQGISSHCIDLFFLESSRICKSLTFDF